MPEEAMIRPVLRRSAPTAFALLLLLGLAAIPLTPVHAQSVWLDRDHRSSVLVETYFPTFDGSDSHFPSWVWFAATRLPIGQTTWFVGELPYASGRFGTTVRQSSIGNPYLGIELAPRARGFRADLGVRVPLESTDKLIPFVMGFYTDIGRSEAFVPDQLTVRLGLHYHRPGDALSRMAYDVRLVPTGWIKTGDALLAESEFFLGYGGTVQYVGDEVRVGGGLTGRWNVTSEVGGFSENSVHQLDLAADFLHGAVRPGVQLKVPLDHDLSDYIDTTFGVSLTVLPGL
jgi:hypothetical protein